jgi:penicillin-insensitive murein endopeptidase
LNLIWHAETVLLQPGDSTPHADHIHLRIACSPEEAVTGCEGGGPLWEWLPSELDSPPLDTAELERIANEDPIGVDSASPIDSANASKPAEPAPNPGGGV